MRTTYTILVAAITLMAAEQASAQSNYWDPRPISRDKQEQPTNTNPARIITAALKCLRAQIEAAIVALSLM